MTQEDKKQKDESKIEKELKYSNSIITTLREPFLVLDKTLQVISANQSFYDTFKVTEKNTIGRLLPDLGNGQWNIPKLLLLLKEILPDKKVVKDYELEHEFEHIGQRTMIINACQLRVPKKMIALIAMVKEEEEEEEEEEELVLMAIGDITERKNMEEELKKTNEKLKELDRLKSDFISTVSHELRSPLSITREGISLVLDKTSGEINEKQEKILDTAKNNIDRLARIVDGLLDLSKIEAGKVELKRELVDIAGLIRQVASPFKLKLKEKNIEFRVNVPEKQSDAFVDRDLLTQVFDNLIGNALKFTERGYIEILLQEKEKEIACIVADTGLGIGKENLPKVFGKFLQFGHRPGTGAKGTGLGLSITKGIIELHGGKIWVESILGQGTKFSFNLPKYTTEEIFKEYLNNGMREATDKKSCMTLIGISITEVNKLKQGFSDKKRDSILMSMEGIIKGTLRCKSDVAFKDSDKIMVILAGCDKEGALSIENRLKEALDKYLINEKLSGEIKLRFGSAVYPDEARSDIELIEKAKKGVN